jgi:hypothetical protein
MNQEGKEGSEINEAHSARDISSLERKKHTFFFYTSTLGLHRESKQILLASLSLSLLFSTFFCSAEKECKYFDGSNRHHRKPNLNGYTVVPIACIKTIA